MARILAIDYGTKRTGLAVTDPLQIIPTGLATVPTHELEAYLKAYMETEEVEAIVIGEPLYPDGNPAQIHHFVVGLARKLGKLFPGVRIAMQDERFTSEEAKAAIRQSGAKKKKRQDKGLVDKISAVIILRDYMDSNLGQ
ncbi:Holliday junction resolvase RuvX [Phaeodactylibacter luteus]|uniref:Putative pre-16S rRNA nuclease n=1 Tax=Phaeodactylibacter luteus TaxID=1564516 RepID=A0A5C6RN30_9BACT|nr:Holliday junction resolvase RuvX [Phaeodactylibacter luteus]TXB63305.1 Holliday junction resolvase RuvX [Phaeodactylibacter luteus]